MVVRISGQLSIAKTKRSDDQILPDFIYVRVSGPLFHGSLSVGRLVVSVYSSLDKEILKYLAGKGTEEAMISVVQKLWRKYKELKHERPR